MKKFLLWISLILSITAVFVVHIFSTTGYFRKIVTDDSGLILQKIPIIGAEDIEIDHEGGFAIVSSEDRAGIRDGDYQGGGLYYLDLTDPEAIPINLTEAVDLNLAPHGISMLKLDSNLYRIWAINHFGGVHSVETFDLKEKYLTHKNTLLSIELISPNDLVAIDENIFYCTNDHGYTSKLGKLAEDYLGLRVSNVVLFDGNGFRAVADDIAYANGINFDPDRKLLFVASPRDFIVKVYQVLSNNDLRHIDDIYAGTGVDNIEFDIDGSLWIGCHPNLLKFASYAKGKSKYAPSEVLRIEYRGIGENVVETKYLENGESLSAATVAVPFGNKVYVGSVIDDNMIVISKK